MLAGCVVNVATKQGEIGCVMGLRSEAIGVLELAGEEASRLGYHWSGKGRISMGSCAKGKGGREAYEALGVELDKVRAETLRVLEERR